MVRKLILALAVFLPALVYQQLQPPPPKICGSPGGPPVTGTRTQLKDGRHLAYLESGVPKDQAKYKIIFVHGFDSCRYDALPISPVNTLHLFLCDQTEHLDSLVKTTVHLVMFRLQNRSDL
jgi:hypothetical protein